MTVDLSWANHPVLLAVHILAVFRLTRLVVADAMPFGVLRARALDALEMRTPWSRKPWAQLTSAETRRHKAFDGMHPLAYLITCYWCVGLYLSVLVTLLASTGPWWWWAAVPLAMSAGIGLLANLSD